MIAAIRRRERNGAIDLPKKRGLKTGDRVRIVSACSRVAPDFVPECRASTRCASAHARGAASGAAGRRHGFANVMYDIDKVLQTPEQCRVVMERALAQGKRDLYTAAFRRFCKLSGVAHEDPSDPRVRATFEAIAAYEQTLHEKHGKRVKASRTRQKIAKKGVYQSLLEWAKLHGNRPGFRSLIDANLPEFTFEAVVVRFANRFPPDVVKSCRETLKDAGAPSEGFV